MNKIYAFQLAADFFFQSICRVFFVVVVRLYVNGGTGEVWIGSMLFVAFVRLSIFQCANIILGLEHFGFHRKQQFYRIKKQKIPLL